VHRENMLLFITRLVLSQYFFAIVHCRMATFLLCHLVIDIPYHHLNARYAHYPLYWLKRFTPPPRVYITLKIYTL